jgi:serine/threonine protein kinase
MAGARLIGNQYRLLEPVGAGGMGRVWRAWDIPLDREVAVKEIVLPPGMTEETWAQVYQRTVREARAAARIRHPGVATVYGMSEQGEAPPWIAMEFVPGCSLDRMLSEDGPLPPVRTAEIGRQVLAALASGHAAGVRHRDLKPANVMITPEGRAVLTDFGIARMIDDPRLTTAGVAIGTPRYMSPERILDRDDDSPAADLWALGAT